MKKYTLYPGCVMQTEQYGYELSIREIFPLLDIELVDVDNFSCCGEPVKSINQLLTLYLSARNLAIAEQKEFDLFVPCSICHFALSECKHILSKDEEMKDRINEMLASEDLEYKGNIDIIHTVDLLYDHIEEIKKHVKKPLKGLKIATHYGCHLVRPSEIGRPDDPENPQKIEAILNAIGAETMDYAEKLDCCGALIYVNLPESALTKTGQKLQAIKEWGFDGMVTVCPWCHRMFDSKQQKAGETVAAKVDLPVLYLTQLIGIAFGIDGEKLGLNLSQSPVMKLEKEIS